MLGAMARAYSVLGDESYLSAAEKNLAFLQEHLVGFSKQHLVSSMAGGRTRSVQLLNAYAYLLAGVIDLYEATFARTIWSSPWP